MFIANLNIKSKFFVDFDMFYRMSIINNRRDTNRIEIFRRVCFLNNYYFLKFQIRIRVNNIRIMIMQYTLSLIDKLVATFNPSLSG